MLYMARRMLCESLESVAPHAIYNMTSMYTIVQIEEPEVKCSTCMSMQCVIIFSRPVHPVQRA